MCYGLKMPALFMTFSPADLHWDSLARHMPNYDQWREGDDTQKMRHARANLRENPHIAAHHFHARFSIFLDNVLKPKFRLRDWWIRYEWQGRGSPYCYGLYWSDTGFTPDLKDEGTRQEFAEKWGMVLTAMNPEPHRVLEPGDANPLIVRVGNNGIEPTFGFLSTVINRVQRHKCSSAYCLRKRKKRDGTGYTEEEYCRFYFPKRTHSTAILTRDLNPGYYVFDAARNDPLLNAFSAAITVGWLANTDVSPYTSLNAIINYVRKYYSKAETITLSYRKIVNQVIL